MITERDLLEAIEECEAEPPSFTSIKKLANLYVVYDHLYGTPKPRVGSIILTKEDGEFWDSVNGKDINKVLAVMAELMESLEVLYPKVYQSVIKKIKEL